MQHLKDLFAGLRLRDALLMGGYALYLAFGYMSFESPTVLASLGEQAALAQSTFLVLALAGRLAVYAATVLIALRLPRAACASPLRAAVLTGAVALAGFLLTHLALDFAAYAPFEKALPWLVLGSFLFGGGSALANLMWARFSGTFDLRSVYLFVLVDNLASLLVYLVVTLLPAGAVFPVSMLVFFSSVVLAKLCLDRRGGAEPARDLPRETFRRALGTLWRPALGTAILFFMSGLMLQMPHNQDVSLAQFQSTSLLTQGVVIAALLVPVLLVKRQPHLSSVFKVALPLSATGFLLLPLIWSGGGGIANACAQLGSGVADIILWCMVAALVHETRLPAVLLFSCTLLATNAAKLAGTLVGLVFQDSLNQGGLALTAIALVAVYLVAMMSMFLFRERGGGRGEASGEGTLAEPASTEGAGGQAGQAGGTTGIAGTGRGEDAFADRCAALASAHGLTPREAELLVQLAQGRTVHAISEKLTVSENTVKYHVKGIYQKLAVHSRDELIDLLGE